MRTRSRTPQSGRAEDAEQISSSYVEDAGLSNPDLGQKHAEQALTPGRMTPARYRFDAAVAYHANYASTKQIARLWISPADCCRAFLLTNHSTFVYPIGHSPEPSRKSLFDPASLTENPLNSARTPATAGSVRRVTTALRCW